VLVCGLVAAVHAGTAAASTIPNWTTGLKAGLPSDAATTPNPGLNAVSCPSAGNCSVVGDYGDSLGRAQGLLLSQSSNAWSPGTKAPLPGDAGTNPAVSVNSVSCVSAGNCAAVGSYHDASGHFQGLLLSESSGVWTAIKAPVPGDAGADPSVFLSAVSCASAGNCTAVGSYHDASGHSQGLLLDEASGSWTAAKATPPGDAGPNPQVSLGSVSCASAGNCVAIGGYRDNLTQNQALLLSESSGTWSAAMQPPLPADGGTNGGHGLRSVSCPSAGNCAVTGYYYDSSGNTQGLLLNESSGTWTPLRAPLPADAGTSPGGYVASVSCAAAGECATGGYYTDASGHSQGLLLSESSGAWSTGIKAPLPSDAGADPSAEVTSVSCATAGSCSAIGSYSDSSGHLQGLLLSEFLGIWATGIRAPLPPDAGPNPEVELNALSCASAGSCTAVNSYQDSSAHYQGLLVSAAPANPTLTLSAPSRGAVGRALATSTVGAVLSGGVSPVGTISFKVFGPQASAPASCASGGKVVGSASVSGNGTYHASAGFTPTSAGHYWWYASYSGDTGDTPASSPCGASMVETVVTSPPRLTHLGQSHRRWRRGKALPHIASAKRPPIGTTFRFTVNERVRVRFAFNKRVKGRKLGRRCVAHRTKGRRCTRTVKSGVLNFSARAGLNKVRFQGRISARKRLKPGRYTLTVTATDSSGQTSAPRSLIFTIV
jgi:hypothetical protein